MSDPHPLDTLSTHGIPDAVPVAAPPAELDLRGYELCESLGKGGMGEVYRCGDPALGRDLAIKIMKAALRHYPEVEQRFLREARITASLQHPGIVAVHNLGRLADGRLHYTMRLVRGRTFADILREEAGQAERLPGLLGIFEKICQAVAYAHSKHVLHRDLKPSNVMVGRFGEVQVMDWGLAKLMLAGADGEPRSLGEEGGTVIHTESSDTPLDLSRAGSGMGTPAYMPPEQALGEWNRVDERADVFALGAILCEMLTGVPPYRGADAEERLRRARRGDLAEAWGSLEACGADAGLIALCRECLAPEYTHRPRHAGIVAERLAAYQTELQARLRRAELERVQAQVKAREERKLRRWGVAFLLLLLAGMAISIWQAVRATQAEHQAQARLKLIERSNDVLTSIFRNLDPREEGEGGASLREQLSKRLERAAEQLDEMAADDPLTAARFQSVLGLSLVELGQPRSAQAMLQKAWPILEARLGPDQVETLTCRSNLARAYWSAGQTAESLHLDEETLRLQRARLGVDHPDTLITCNNVAEAYREMGRTDEAIRLHEETLRLRRARLGEDDIATLLSRNNLALAYFDRGRIGDALRLDEETLRLYQAKLGNDHPDTLTARNNLAEAYRSAGRLTESIRLHEDNLKLRQDKLGSDHPLTLFTMANLGMAYRDAGRMADALRLLEEALERGRRRPGGLLAKLAWIGSALAKTHEQAGQFDRAEPHFRAYLEQTRRQLGADDPRTLGAMAVLGLNLLHQQKYTEAEPLLRDCLTARTAGQPDAWTTFHTRSLLGEALLGQKKFAEAGPLLRQGYEGMIARQAAIPKQQHFRLHEALSRLVRFYEATNEKAQADRWRKEGR